MFEILYKKTQTSLQINNTHPDPDQQTWLKAKKNSHRAGWCAENCTIKHNFGGGRNNETIPSRLYIVHCTLDP